MASSHGHGTGKQNEAREARRERNRTGGEVNPAAVAAVIQFGYAPDLVMSTYQRLLSTCAKDSQHAELPPPESGASNRTGSASPRDISASALLVVVDDAMGQANLVGDVAFNSSFATSSETAGFASSLVVTGTEGDGMTHIGDLQDDGSSDGDAASSRNAPDQNQMDSNTAVNHPQSSTSNQSPTSNMEGTSSKESAPVTTPSAEGQADTEAAPPVTSSDDVRRDMRSPEGRSPMSVITTGETSHPTAASSAVEASAAVAARESPAAVSSQGAESGSGSRDRSSDRRENVSAEEKLRERRRQLNRLRALRAEHRRLKARQTCLHCRKNPVTLTLLPCGHFIFCQECGSSFDACPLCRKTILADVRTFLS